MPSQPPKKNSLLRRMGPPSVSAINVDEVLRLGSGVEEVLGLQRAVIVKSPRRAMKVVRPGLRDDRDRGAAGESLLRIEVVGNDIHGVDGLGRRDISGVMRQP